MVSRGHARGDSWVPEEFVRWYCEIVCGRYVSLLEASVLAQPAPFTVDACGALQSACAANSDWRFRFGAVGLLSEVRPEQLERTTRSAGVRGARHGGHLTSAIVLPACV